MTVHNLREVLLLVSEPTSHDLVKILQLANNPAGELDGDELRDDFFGGGGGQKIWSGAEID